MVSQLSSYYGFPDHFYTTEWHSNGSSELSAKIVSLLKDAGITARTTSRTEPRGEDGKIGQASGLDHGVFIPFKLMSVYSYFIHRRSRCMFSLRLIGGGY